MYPENFRYTKEHEWVLRGRRHRHGRHHRPRPEGTGRHRLRGPAQGRRRTSSRASRFGSVESVKAVSDIYSPVSGEVVEVNAALADAPEKLNEDPHGAAWLVKIKLAQPGRSEAAACPPPITRTTSGSRRSDSCAIFRSPIPSAARCWSLRRASPLEDLFAHLPGGGAPEAAARRSQPGHLRVRDRRVLPRARRRERQRLRLASSAPASTTTTGRCWWMRWSRAASSSPPTRPTRPRSRRAP